jgi:hypothetical protein
MTVIPAYGRDYKTAAAARADWDANLDFIICDISSRYDGKYVNKEQVPGEDITIRFNNRYQFGPTMHCSFKSC